MVASGCNSVIMDGEEFLEDMDISQFLENNTKVECVGVR